MPTDEWFKENPKVSAYISQDLNEKLLKWMKGRSIKKVSQALTAILEEYLGVAQAEPITQPVRDDRLEALEQKLESLFQIVQELREPVQVSSQRVVQTELFPVKSIERVPVPVVQTEPIEEILSLAEAIAIIDTKQPIDIVEEIQDDEPDEILLEFLETENQGRIKKDGEDGGVEQTKLIEHEVWTTQQVNEVLGIARSSLERWKKEDAFPKTIKEHTILKWAGKQATRPFGNLWEVRKPHSAAPKTDEDDI